LFKTSKTLPSDLDAGFDDLAWIKVLGGWKADGLFLSIDGLTTPLLSFYVKFLILGGS